MTDVANGYVIADAIQLISTSAPPNQVVWSPDLTHAAEYEVYARWSAHGNRASNAAYVIDHAAGEATAVVNQQQSGGAGNLLGTYRLDANSTIALSDVANGYVIADAIQLRQVEGTAEVPLAPYYVHGDHLGVARVITDEAGEIAWAADRLPFGQTTTTTEAITYNLRFPGQYYDDESGLHYNYYRGFDPGLGRYVQSDPIGLQGGFNTYAYVGGNPIRYSDPRGLVAQVCLVPPVGAGCVAAAKVVVEAIVLGTGIAMQMSLDAEDDIESCAAEGSHEKEDDTKCKKASGFHLKSAGIVDAHAFKSDWGAVPNSRFDICACDDGRIIIKAQGQCGSPGPSISTGSRWK